MEAPGVSQFEFGAFRFDAIERVLYRGGQRVPLAPKAADTLLVLLENHGRVVDKNELMQRVWPDIFVEEGGLARNISALRKVLGDGPEGGSHIETVPKRGYRFVASLNAPSPSPPPALPRRTRRVRTAILAGSLLLAAVALLAWLTTRKGAPFQVGAVAVLPMKSLSGEAEDYFAEGVTDVIATDLSKTGVRVIAPASVRRLRPNASLDEIGRRLNVDAVVQGTVLKSGERVRVNAQLVEVRTGRLMWGDNYERELRDVLALQADVATAIARNVSRVSAGPAEPAAVRPVLPEAYQAYLRGRFFWNKRTEPALRKAVDYFNEAIAKDNTYAPAYAGLADSWALLASTFYDAVPPREAMPRAKAAALHALELDGSLAEAHSSLAYVRMAYDWDLAGAEKEFQRAEQSDPGYATAHHWHAHCLLASGRMDDAAAEMRRAQSLDPLSLPVNVGIGWCSYFGRKYDDAIRQYRATLELEPDFALAHQALGMALLRKHDFAPAIAEFQAAVNLSQGSAAAIGWLGYAYASAGTPAAAREQLARLSDLGRQRYVPSIYMALVTLGLGDQRQFLSWFAKARDERSEYLIYYRFDPSFEGAPKLPGLVPGPESYK